MHSIFSNRTKELEISIDKYINMVEHASLLFLEGIKTYLCCKTERFQNYHNEITALESEADRLRRDIKEKLYTYMLIPEARGDVLGLLETLDDVIDTAEKILEQFSIELPQIPEFLHEGFTELAELSYKAVEDLTKASKAFFNDIKAINSYINKVHFYEHEADKVEEQLKRKIFSEESIPELYHRVYLRYFVEQIALLSDEAESVGERLAIYAIKRRI